MKVIFGSKTDLEDGAKFHHEQGAVQELPWKLLCSLGWRHEPVAVRRGEETERDARYWEEDLFSIGYWEEDLLYTRNQVQCGNSLQQNAESERAHSQTKQDCSPTHQKDWLNCIRKIPCYSCQQLQCDSKRKSSSVEKTCRLSRAGRHPWRKTLSASFYSRSLDLFLHRGDLLRKKRTSKPWGEQIPKE